MVDPQIFESLQTKIDEDSEVREQIKSITQTLERQGRTAQAILSKAHSTPAAQRKLPRDLWNMANINSPACPRVCRSCY